jgi:hypothetical protein
LESKEWCIPVADKQPSKVSTDNAPKYQNVKFGRVSKKCLKVLMALYERPLIFITQSSPLLTSITFLKLFLVLKKKLIIIFDILCKPSYMIRALAGAIIHWLFPGNFISLADIHALYVSQGQHLEPYQRKNDIFPIEEVRQLELNLLRVEKGEFDFSLNEDTMERLEKLSSSKINSNSIIKIAQILIRLFKVHVYKCVVGALVG